MSWTCTPHHEKDDAPLPTHCGWQCLAMGMCRLKSMGSFHLVTCATYAPSNTFLIIFIYFKILNHSLFKINNYKKPYRKDLSASNCKFYLYFYR